MKISRYKSSLLYAQISYLLFSVSYKRNIKFFDGRILFKNIRTLEYL